MLVLSHCPLKKQILIFLAQDFLCFSLSSFLSSFLLWDLTLATSRMVILFHLSGLFPSSSVPTATTQPATQSPHLFITNISSCTSPQSRLHHLLRVGVNDAFREQVVSMYSGLGTAQSGGIGGQGLSDLELKWNQSHEDTVAGGSLGVISYGKGIPEAFSGKSIGLLLKRQQVLTRGSRRII